MQFEGFGIHDWQREQALRLIEVYREKVNAVIFPAFGRIAIEAEEFTRDALSGLLSRYDPENADEADLAERAHDAGTARFGDLDQALQGVANGSIANLYHFGWETPVREWLRRSSALTNAQRKKVENGEYRKTLAVLEDFGFSIDDQEWAGDLNELRLIANAIKHNRGGSTRELFELRRRLFFPFNRMGEGEHIDYEPDGNDLIPTADDFDRYVRALRDFWMSLPEAPDWF